MYKILIFGRVFCPDPHRPFGDFENPLGQHAVPSRIFKILAGLRGILGKIPSQKSEFSIQIPSEKPNFSYKF